MPQSSVPPSSVPDVAAGFDFAAMAGVMDSNSPPGAEPDRAPGTVRRFGDYFLEEEIARGGMGVVYAATQISLERRVAVKMLRDSAMAGSDQVERFRREATAAATLRHRNIVAIHEIAEHEGTHFFSMDYVPGETLAQMLVNGPLAPRHAAAVMIKIAHAIHHAHTHGVLHRDLKPSNVIMDAGAEPMVTDFGLAKQDSAEMGLTLSGQVLGTPAYMAPEQASGNSHKAGPATDVYGLGALLYHLLAGRPPFSGASHLAIMQQVMTREPVSITVLTSSVSRDLDTICAQAMARDPARRYASALAFAEDLQRYLDGKPVLARPVPGVARLWRWACRHPALATSLAGVVLLLATVAVGSTMAAQRLRISQREASTARDLARENAARSKLNLYASDMRIAMESWDRGALEAARQRLDEHVPAAGEPDPRSFEWHMLDTFLQGEQTRRTELPGKPSSAAFTPDAGYAVFTVGTQTHLWDAAGKIPLFTWEEPAHDAEVSSRMLLRVTPQSLAATGPGGLRLIDLQSRQTRLLDAAPCESLALSADGTRLAVAARMKGNSTPAGVRIYDTGNWNVVREIPADCRGLDWCADGQLVMLKVQHDGPRSEAGILEWIDPARQGTVKQVTVYFHSLVRRGLLNAKADRAYVMLECLDDHLIELSTGKDLFGRPSSASAQCGADAGFEWMAYAGQDPTVRLLQLPTWGGVINPRRGHTGQVLALACMGGGSEFRSIARDGTMREWNFNLGPHDYAHGITRADSRTAALAMSPVSGRYIGMLEEWYGQNGKDLSTIFDRDIHHETHSLECAVMGISEDGTQAIGLQKNQLRRYVLSTGHADITPILDFAEQPVAWLPRISKDWQRVAWTSDDRKVSLTEVSTGREIGRYDLVSGAPAFSPDGSTLAIPQQTILLVNASTGTATDTGLASGPMLAWSADGRNIATLLNSDICLYHLAERRLTHRLHGHSGNLTAMAWTPDGRSLATGSDENTLTFWNLATSRPTAEVKLHGGPFLLGFAGDNSALVAGTMKGYRILRAVPMASGR